MSLKRGILKSFDSGAYKAALQLDGSLAGWLTDVAVSRAIPSAEMSAGRSVAVVFFEDGNPKDAVVIAVWS